MPQIHRPSEADLVRFTLKRFIPASKYAWAARQLGYDRPVRTPADVISALGLQTKSAWDKHNLPMYINSFFTALVDLDVPDGCYCCKLSNDLPDVPKTPLQILRGPSFHSTVLRINADYWDSDVEMVASKGVYQRIMKAIGELTAKVREFKQGAYAFSGRPVKRNPYTTTVIGRHRLKAVIQNDARPQYASITVPYVQGSDEQIDRLLTDIEAALDRSQ